MSQEDRDKFFAELDRRGEASVRADLEAGHFGARKALATEWVGSKEIERARRAEQRDDRMVEATLTSRAAISRSIAKKYLNSRPIVVVNRVGASGAIGSMAVRTAAPDGCPRPSLEPARRAVPA
jgi:hypothetical protein